MGPYLGDYLEDTQYLDFKWDTNDASGASITRAVDGTISVYKGNSDAQSVAGVTDTEDFDGLTGIHHLRIDLAADAFYEVGYDYSVVLSAATIDGETVNAVLATFSIENRYMRGTDGANTTVPDAAGVAAGLHATTDGILGTPANIDAGGATLADNLKKLADDNGGADFDASTDSQLAIRDAIAAGAPVLYNPDGSSVINVGNQDANTYAACATDDGTRWTIGDEAGGGGSIVASATIEVVCEMNMGSNRIAQGVTINGYFNRSGGGGYVAEIYVYNYTTSSWDKLSAGTEDTEMRDRVSDKTYSFSLSSDHTDPSASVGEVRIGFASTRLTVAGGDVLYLDYLAVSGLAAGATDPAVIADAVWTDLRGNEIVHHIDKYTGEVWYVDGDSGSDVNAGDLVHEAFATMGAGVYAASAGDRIIVKAAAAAYDENGLDFNKANLELRCEYGTTLVDTATGAQTLLVSGASCIITGLVVAQAGQTAFRTTSAGVYFDRCIASGASIGFDLEGAGNVAIESASVGHTTTGFDLSGGGHVLHRANSMGTGGATRGFYLSANTADRGMLNGCISVDNATAGYEVVAGADNNAFKSCVSGDGDGAMADAGTDNIWADFHDSDIVDVNTTQIEGSDPTDQIRDAVVDDGTRIDASALNTLSGHAPDNTIADVDDITGLENLSQAESQAAAMAALNAYDPPTRTEATTDKNDIITEVDANETKIDALENLSQAESQAAAIAALNAYDPPTRAEATTDKNDIITEVDANEAKIDTVITNTGNIETDTQNIQSRIPAALVGGRMDADVGNMQNNVITAASIATDAIGADEIAAGGVTEIASGVDVTLTAAHGAGSWAAGAAAPTAVQIRQEMDTNSTQLAQIIADIAAQENLSEAQVKAQMLDVLNVDTFGEPGQGAPPATTTLQLKLAYLYKAFRNKLETTATEARIYNDAGGVVDQKASLSDDGATFTRGEFGTGP